MNIPAITVIEPWASLIVWGVKQFETRSWKTAHRGLIAIHAGKTWGDEEKEWARRLAKYEPRLRGFKPELGAVLGVARLVNVFGTQLMRDRIGEAEKAFGNWQDGRYAWQLEVVEAYTKPIPRKGAQGLWTVELPELKPHKPKAKPAPMIEAEYVADDQVQAFAEDGPVEVVNNLLVGHSDKNALALLKIYEQRLPDTEREWQPLRATYDREWGEVRRLIAVRDAIAKQLNDAKHAVVQAEQRMVAAAAALQPVEARRELMLAQRLEILAKMKKGEGK